MHKCGKNIHIKIQSHIGVREAANAAKSSPRLEVQGGDVEGVPAGQRRGVLFVGHPEYVPRELHGGGAVRVVAEDARQRHPLDGGQLRGGEHAVVRVEEAVARLQTLKLER